MIIAAIGVARYVLFINVYFWRLGLASFVQIMLCAASDGFIDCGDIG